jgi:hypothetical protein
VFHTLFCAKESIPSAQDFAEWAIEAAAFDDIPRFEPPFDELGAGEWSSIDVVYDAAKRPVQFVRYTGGHVGEHVDAAVEMLAMRGFEGRGDLLERLRRSKQVVLIEFDELLADEEVWEFLDVIETRLARELDGIIFSADEGFFNGHNQPLCAFS